MKGIKKLIFFWFAQFISAIGDNFFFASSLFLVLLIEKEKSSLKIGFVSFSETLPYLLFGVIAGTIIDRMRKKNVLLFSDIARAILLFSTPFLLKFGYLNFLSVAFIAFLLSTFSSFFNPARDASIPLIAEGKTLLRVNAFVQSSFQIASFVGTFLAGLILHFLKGEAVFKIIILFLLDGLTFIFSFFLILPIEIKEKKEVQIPFLKDLKEGLLLIFKDPLLKGLLILTALDNFFIMGPAVVGANLLIKNFFNLSVKHLAWFESSLSLGWLLGTVFIAKYGVKFSKGKLLIFGIFMDGFTYMPFILIKNYTFALIIIFIHGIFIAFITVPRTTLIQEYINKNLVARVFALIQLTVVGFMALSSFTTGALGEVLSPPFLFFLGGTGGALSGILAFLFFKKLWMYN